MNVLFHFLNFIFSNKITGKQCRYFIKQISHQKYHNAMVFCLCTACFARRSDLNFKTGIRKFVRSRNQRLLRKRLFVFVYTCI